MNKPNWGQQDLPATPIPETLIEELRRECHTSEEMAMLMESLRSISQTLDALRACFGPQRASRIITLLASVLLETEEVSV